MNSDVLCQCESLRKSFRRNDILKGCTLHVRAGELVGLCGENGAGKSTLIRCLLGFLRPNSGRITMRGPVGYCPQDMSLNQKYTVSEHLRLVNAIHSRCRLIDPVYIENLIFSFKLAPFMTRLIGELSGGTSQKVKLVTALYHHPRLLLLDEPYDGFDWQMYHVFWQTIADLQQSGAGILLISHLFHDFAKFDRIYELRDGIAVQNEK